MTRSVVLLTDDARSGTSPGHNVRYVLGWGLASVGPRLACSSESWRRMAFLYCSGLRLAAAAGSITFQLPSDPITGFTGTAHSLELRKSPAAASLGRASDDLSASAGVEGTGRRDPEWHIIDSHFHCGRDRCPNGSAAHDYPRAACQRKRRLHLSCAQTRRTYNVLSSWTECSTLDKQLRAHGRGSAIRWTCLLDRAVLGVSSPTCRRRKGATPPSTWNEEMASAQRKYPGRVWASAAHCES